MVSADPVRPYCRMYMLHVGVLRPPLIAFSYLRLNSEIILLMFKYIHNLEKYHFISQSESETLMKL